MSELEIFDSYGNRVVVKRSELNDLKRQLEEAKSCPKCPKCNEKLEPYILDDSYYGDSLNWFCGCEPEDLPMIEEQLKEKGDE